MKANVTLIMLTVADIGKATRFYENLGFVKSKESQEEVSFFHAGGIVLSLWSRKAQIEDANAGALWHGRDRCCAKCRKRGRGRCGTSESEGCRSAHLEAGNQDFLGRL